MTKLKGQDKTVAKDMSTDNAKKQSTHKMFQTSKQDKKFQKLLKKQKLNERKKKI